MRQVYHYSAAECDDMTEAEFAGYVQNLDYLEERQALFIARALAPLMGIRA